MIKCDILIKNCNLLTPDFEISENKSIVVKDSRIAEIGSYEDLKKKYKPENILNGKGRLCMPGLVDSHTHTCQQLLRGRTMGELPMIWSRILVPFEGNLNESDAYVSGQMSCLEMIKSGTTAFADAGGVHMHKVIEAVIESGMRAAITRSSIDIGDFLPDTMKEPSEKIIENNKWLFNNYHNSGNGRINVWFGVRQLLSCSPDLIEAAAHEAQENQTGLHLHLAEHRDEVRFCLEKYGKRPVEYLNSLGVLGPNLLAAHSVMYSENELDILKEYDVKIVHCPRPNFNSHGFPKTPRMLQMGMNVGIGSDGASGSSLSLFDEIKVFRSGIHAYWGLSVFDPLVLSAKDLLKMITLGGARTLQIENDIGTIEVNKKADIILIDIDQPHITPTNNLINTVVESVTSNDVKDVVIDGKIVMKDREVLTLDEERIIYESKLKMKSITERAGI